MEQALKNHFQTIKGATSRGPSFVFKEFEPAKKLPLTKETCNFAFRTNQAGKVIHDRDLQKTNKFGTSININFLRHLGNVPLCSEWYIVADKNVLLEDFDFLIEFINKDNYCKLLPPKAVLVQLENMSKESSDTRSDVLPARALLRRLAACTKLVHEFNEDEGIEGDVRMYVTLNIQIIQCCLLMKNRNLHVVLVTKSLKLKSLAKINEIHVYTIEELKNDPKTITPNASTRVCSRDIATMEQNIFLQDMSRFDPFMLSRNFQSDIYSEDQHFFNSSTKNFEELYSDVCRSIELLNTNDNRPKCRSNDEIRSISTQSFTQHRKSYKGNLDEYLNEQNKNDYVQSVNVKKIYPSFQKSSTVIKSFNPFFCETVEGGTNTSRQYIVENLKGFHIKNETMRNNLILRFEEWACCYLQIMEQLGVAALQKINAPEDVSRWLQTQLQNIKESYYTERRVCIIVDELIVLLDYCMQEGRFKTSTAPETFMRILGFSDMLIKAIERVSPRDEITDTKIMMTDLILNIENPQPEDIFTEINYSVAGNNDEYPTRRNYKKSKSDVADYIKKHFSANEDCTDDVESLRNLPVKVKQYNNFNILQTTGKYTNLMNINNRNQLQFIPHNTKTNNNNKIETRKIEQIQNENKTKESSIDIPVLHENTFGVTKSGPKIIRTLKFIEKYEKKLQATVTIKSKEKLKTNNDDTESPKQKATGDSDVNNRYKTQDKGTEGLKSSRKSRDSKTQTKEENNDYLNVYEIIQLISSTLSETLWTIKIFCQKTIKEIQDGASKERRRSLIKKIWQSHRYILLIIEQLEKIVVRESTECDEFTKRAIAPKDKAHYREIILKFLSRTQILESTLTKLLDAIDG